jgi:hypothetical protein
MPAALILACCALLQPAGWAIKDQFGREHSADVLAGRAVLLVGGDRDARPGLEPWIDAVAGPRRATDDSAAYLVVRVADLRKLPRLMRGMITSRAPRDTTRRLLLDFQGVLAARYGFRAGTTNVIVLDRRGQVIARAVGTAPDASDAARLTAALRRAAASPR